MTKQSGKVIILNGPSVAGKSSIQKALQQEMKTPYMAMGIDSILVAMMPQRYFLGLEEDRKEVLWGEPSEDENGRPLFHLYFGPQGRNVIFGMNEAIAAFARNGNNVIVDYIQYEPEWIPHLMNALEGIETYCVGVEIPLDVLEERESSRATSPKGHARSHYETVHAGANYDLTVNSGEQSPEACAAQIMEHIKQAQACKEGCLEEV